MSTLVLRGVEVDGRVTDVVIEAGRVRAIGPGLPAPPGADVLDGAGGALIPGLWDHHIHLVALAAARASVRVGPPEVRDAASLAAALRAAPRAEPGGWVRAVGYHESVAGLIDRYDLDRLLPGVPLRVQHRSGAMWVLSSEALARLGADDGHDDVLERDDRGELTGRTYGGDAWLRARLAQVAPGGKPDLAAVGSELAGYGIVGVTDATPYEDLSELDLLVSARTSGALPQRVVAMGGPSLAGAPFPRGLERGPVKLLLADHDLPALDQVVGWIAVAREHGRPVAIHCVTRAALVLTLAALDVVPRGRGQDRIEHGSVVPPELRTALRVHRLTVVTQPNFVAERGDRYLAEVEPHDRPHLYACRSLLDAGIPVAGSTDAPFGHPDPWRAIAAAIDRRTAEGASIGPQEAVTPEAALGLLLGGPGDPGGPARRVEVGAPADLCLLVGSLEGALREPNADQVRATIIGGHAVHEHWT